MEADHYIGQGPASGFFAGVQLPVVRLYGVTLVQCLGALHESCCRCTAACPPPPPRGARTSLRGQLMRHASTAPPHPGLQDGYSVLAHVHEFRPYFYVPAPKDFNANHLDGFRRAVGVRRRQPAPGPCSGAGANR